MISDIKGTPPAKPEAYAPKVQPSVAANAPKPLDATVRKAEIVPIKKADIAIDPVEMQQKLKKVLEEANQHMANSKVQLGFSMNQSIDGPVITVKNLQSGEVVRTIPSEAVIKVAQNIDSLKGILFNQKL
ncbi:MAG: flagellar protein FlaG [Burkholderiaceae bacterium]|jgi:flagellar protein FlaG|nr:flagellar protein FlaG [Burkholderiaceae bacterium]